MAQRGRRGPREGREDHDRDDHDERHEHRHDRDRDRGGDGDGDCDDEYSGDNPALHAAIIAQRWVGSVPPTAALYARARAQWMKLPGATVNSATDVSEPEPEPVPQSESGEDAP